MTAQELDLQVGRLALRTFRMWAPQGKDERFLAPMGMLNDHWADGTCTARCLKATMAGGKNGVYETTYGDTYYDNKHEAPDMGCNCGVYGSLTYDSLRRQYHSHMDGIITVMAAEGRTIIGTRGLRTQFARIISYYPIDPACGKLAKVQFAEAEVHYDLFDMLEAHGFQSPTYGPIPKDNWEGWTA